MDDNENNLGNLEFTNIILLIPCTVALYILYSYDSSDTDKKKRAYLSFLLLLSFLIIIIDKFGGPFKFFQTKKHKVDYKKLIFIMIYIALAFFYNNSNSNNNFKDYIQKTFAIILIIMGIIFSILETKDETFLTFEYLLYHWITFIMVFSFYYLAKDDNFAKKYLVIMMILSCLCLLIKPLIDVAFGIKTWKYSNYKYFNKNILIKEKKNNRNVFNNLMNYIIINIILLGVYIAITNIL
jgi:hypothetical protein